ncbi:PBSX family phage terminase large subunit [Methanobrevibacter sp. DSM 116169]|uniref:PBSX family phage terminase large subunit n=1 Tax=Methanobrevibacter sp. DSM 116169 TaxID=3242727 RepID=UPI0038FD0245
MTDWILTDKQAEHIYDETPELMIEGSAGSGKTIFACTKTILYALNYAGARIGVFRQTLPSLKKTAWKEIRELLWKHDVEFQENKTDGVMTFSNGSSITFSSLDDLRKVRSLNLDFIYVEQAEEISKEVYVELTLRIRNTVSQEYYGQMLLVVQPEGTDHWLYQYFYKQELEDTKHIHFHYRQNPKLPEKRRKYYDKLEIIDKELWLKYSAGKWGKLTNTIYENWDTKTRDNFRFYTGGIDFGFNAPSVFLLCGWFDDECYIVDEVYESGLTTPDFIDKVKSLLAKHELSPTNLDMVYADSANPDDIEEFNRAGFDIVGGVKNVEAKIQSVKQTVIHISNICVSTIKEIGNYKWMTDRDGNILDKPLKLNDHAMDALGYTVYGVRGALSPYGSSDYFDSSDIGIY